MKKKENIQPYRNSMEHISDELRRLDILLGIRVAAFRRQAGVNNDPETKQIYIHDREIDRLLDTACAASWNRDMLTDEEAALKKIEERIAKRIGAATETQVFLGLQSLAALYGLSAFEKEAVLICMAADLDIKYRRIYAYLQDDITLQYPTADFIARLVLSGSFDHWHARTVFSSHSPLLRGEILQPLGGREFIGWQRRGYRLNERIANFLLGKNVMDDRLAGLCRLSDPCMDDSAYPVDGALANQYSEAAHMHLRSGSRKKIIFHFSGRPGSGKVSLSSAIVRNLGFRLIVCDAGFLRQRDTDFGSMLRLVLREGLLLSAAVCFENLDPLMTDADRSAGSIKTLLSAVEEAGWLVFLLSTEPAAEGLKADGLVVYTKVLPVSDAVQRRAVWSQALAGIPKACDEDWAGLLSSRFRLTPGHIFDSISSARNEALLAKEPDTALLPYLMKACKEQSNRRLADLSLKLDPQHVWEDLVLPNAQLSLLREICGQVKHRGRVYGDWGFDRIFSSGKGLSILFSGPPGTGKTMASGVIARELGLDIYKIDLSGVVSKYIGETEKNLSRIFEEAETANAILFFDEADAIFGKRTEVSDSHDRYANIEVSYLLQKMEEYDGIVILASNLRQNIDEAFVRRIRFIVEFPFPDEKSRKRIWESHFPASAPVSDGIDLHFLSRTFEVSGGHIRNIVLNAAFLAAGNGNVISMDHVLRSVRQEYEKMGTVWSDELITVPVEITKG